MYVYLEFFFQGKTFGQYDVEKVYDTEIYYNSNSSITETQRVGTLPKNEIVHEIDTEIHCQKHWDTQC